MAFVTGGKLLTKKRVISQNMALVKNHTLFCDVENASYLGFTVHYSDKMIILNWTAKRYNKFTVVTLANVS